jgi:hypothetical protein
MSQKSHNSAILFARSNKVNCYGDVAASAAIYRSDLTVQPLMSGMLVSRISEEGKPTTPLAGIRSQVPVKHRERGKAKRC